MIPAPEVNEVQLISTQTPGRFDGVRLFLSQPLDTVTAVHRENYRLREAGPDGLFDPPGDPTPDDLEFSVTVGRNHFGTGFFLSYHSASNYIDLIARILVAPLPVGKYRLELDNSAHSGSRVRLARHFPEVFLTNLNRGRKGSYR